MDLGSLEVCTAQSTQLGHKKSTNRPSATLLLAAAAEAATNDAGAIYQLLGASITELKNDQHAVSRLLGACTSMDLILLPDNTQEAAERAAAAEAAARDAGAAIARLEAHVADLESRKRAPLYQKRQEEELAAAVARAAEAEERAAAAEARAKDAKVPGGLATRLPCSKPSP